jgi:hypothetical protein
MLERLVYRSQATHKLGSLHLFNLLVQCRKRNLSLGITGHLLYTEEIFVQCIEGPSGSIDALWKSLQRDERHHSLELLSRGPITDRQFSDWAMAFSSYAHFDKYDIPGFFRWMQRVCPVRQTVAPSGAPSLCPPKMTLQLPEKSGALTGFAQVPEPSVP